MEQIRIRCALIRGGTSKGVYILENDLPQDSDERNMVILKIFGSPDIRQIDGLGGADPLTSKLAIIGPPTRPDADVDYTFGQVSINDLHIDYSGNCGNISAGVGPFAIDEGFIIAKQPATKVRIHNKNTGKLIIAEVEVIDGKAKVSGDYQIDGVPGKGSQINLDFADAAGAVTGNILPTGNVIDNIVLDGKRKIEVSIVDVGNPMVFVRAKDLDLSGVETPKEIDSNKYVCALLEMIRGNAAVIIGMARDLAEATKYSPAFPMIACVSPSQDYYNFLSGSTILEEEVDLVSRMMFMQVMHKTYAGTATICTGAAARIKGTIVEEVCSSRSETIRIGHPAGVIPVEVEAWEKEGDWKLNRAAFGRTARRIMDGYVYICK